MTNETNALQSLKKRRQELKDFSVKVEQLCHSQGLHDVLNRVAIGEALEKLSQQIESAENPIKVSDYALLVFLNEDHPRVVSCAKDFLLNDAGLKECVDKLGDGTYPITRELEAVVVDRVVVDVRRKGE